MRLEDPRESNKRFFRASKRVISQNGAWYFTTREGQRGPFDCPEEAELQLQRFKVEMNELQSFQKSRAVRQEQQRNDLVKTRELAAKLREARSGKTNPLKLRQVLV